MRKLEEDIKAVVQKIIPEGDHGPFAVATSESIDGSITFSLEPTVWQEDEWPEQGMIVVLGKLRKKRSGWRAKEGRFLKPSDEQIENQERRKEMKKMFKVFGFGKKKVSEKITLSELRLESLPGVYVNVGCAGVLCETPTTRQGIFIGGVKDENTGQGIKKFFLRLTTPQMDEIVRDYLTWNVECQKETVEKLLNFRRQMMAAPSNRS